MKNLSLFLSLLVAFLFLNNPVYAHPGRTDSSGCHTCRTNCPSWGLSYGEYHCHNGGSAASNDSVIQSAPVQQQVIEMPTNTPIPTKLPTVTPTRKPTSFPTKTPTPTNIITPEPTKKLTPVKQETTVVKKQEKQKSFWQRLSDFIGNILY